MGKYNFNLCIVAAFGGTMEHLGSVISIVPWPRVIYVIPIGKRGGLDEGTPALAALVNFRVWQSAQVGCRISGVDRTDAEAAMGVDRVYPKREVSLGYGRLETCF